MNNSTTLIKRTAVGLAMTQPLLFVACGSAEQPVTPPNIVVVLCDDLGYGDLSCYGHDIIKTPNLDRLAAEGIKLTNFYSSAAVSSPSRAGLLTGRNPNRAGIYDFIPGPKKSADCRDIVHLQEYETTIPQLLKGAGYATCLSGKWHCSSRFNTKLQPQPDHFGFDHWFSTGNNAAPTHQNPTNFVRNGVEVGEQEGFSCELVVNEALSWLKGQSGEQPFYLHVTFHEPHEPIASPQDLVDKHMPHSENVHQAEYFANVENMDRNLGRLLDYICEHHGDNTLVVFSADNGPETLNRYSRAYRSYGVTGGLKGHKLWTTDGGIHVAGIMKWFGRETFNGETNAVVSALDYMPTFCELAGVELPERELDGESFVELFKNGEFERDGALLWVFYNPENEQAVAMRYGDWKILCNLTDENGDVLPKIYNLYEGNYDLVKNATMSDFSLYNLKEDRNETTDLSESNPEKLEEMKAMLRAEYDKLVADSHVWVRENKKK